MLIWTLQGDALDRLREELEGGRTLRVAVDGGDFKYKVNEGGWTAGIEPDENDAGARVYVASLPDCDICWHYRRKPGVPSMYDGKTHRGPWVFMCGDCFPVYAVGLGVGKGQRLIVTPGNE